MAIHSDVVEKKTAQQKAAERLERQERLNAAREAEEARRAESYCEIAAELREKGIFPKDYFSSNGIPRDSEISEFISLLEYFIRTGNQEGYSQFVMTRPTIDSTTSREYIKNVANKLQKDVPMIGDAVKNTGFSTSMGKTYATIQFVLKQLGYNFVLTV